jgi:hypothetical protein
LAEGIEWLIHTHSKRCQRHTGQHFSKTTCSPGCVARHRRCRNCGRLCGGLHQAELREGLCWQQGEPSCWREVRRPSAHDVYDAICLLCGRVAYRDVAPGPHMRCGACGGGFVLQPQQERHLVSA